MGTVINTGLLTRDARSEFLNRFESMDALANYNQWATRIASTKDSENYRWLGTVPNMREWGTGRAAKGLRSESYDVTNLKYEATLEVDRDELADDQTGQIRVRVAELAQRAATHKDYLIGQLIANGATSGFNSYDGVTFFNASHTSGASGAQSNLTTTVAASDTSVPTTAEFGIALRLSIAAMMNFKDDQGEPMMLSQGGLVIAVPTALYMVALEAVNATIIANTTNVLAGVATVVSFPWLVNTSTETYYYLLKTDGIVRPFIFQDREPIAFTSLAEGSEEDFKREKFLYGVRARYRMTYGYWQDAVKHTFTT